MSETESNQSIKRAKSLLTSVQKAWLTLSLSLAALLLANTLYLVANRVPSIIPGGSAENFSDGTYTLSRFFQIMVLSHTGLGFLVSVLLLIFAAWHLPSVWRRRQSKTVTSGIIFLVLGVIVSATGPFIMHAAASRDHTWVWWLHVIAAGLVIIAYVVHRALSVVRPYRANYSRFSQVVLASFLILIFGHGFTIDSPSQNNIAASEESRTGPGSRMRDLAEFSQEKYTSPSFVPPASPFFPSAATTTTGGYLPERIITRGDTSSAERMAKDLDQLGFVVSEKIGAETCDRCHADIVAQWAVSAHRFASFNNPFYEASVVNLRETSKVMTAGVSEHVQVYPHWKDRIGEIKSKWCSGCHDPAIMLAGQMTEDVDRRTPQAQAGLTCLACHAIDKIHNTTGNGNYNIADHQEDPYLFADAPSGSLKAWLHDTSIKAKPDIHKARLLKPFYREAEYCATCHKVSLQPSLNDYRWLRGQNEYDNWHDSGVALNAARTFYLPPLKNRCQDCHMPLEPAPMGDLAAKNGMVRSHRFLAANTALPFLRGDLETIKQTEAFLQSDKLRIDIFALKRESDDENSKTVYALDHWQPVLYAHETVVVDVVVRNAGVGHTFPGGTNDSNEAWIEFTVLDEQGQEITQSGAMGDDGYVDEQAHFFKALLVDRLGNPIHQRNAQDIYAPIYVNVIGPGTAHAIHYRITVPDLPGQQLTLRARLMWRKFDRFFTEFSYKANPEGFKQFDQVPDLPVTEIVQTQVTLPIMRRTEGQPVMEPPLLETLAQDWMRYNDYGISLLLQNDTRSATDAFGEVARLVPTRLDGHANLARVALREGKLEEAYTHLLTCESLDSNNPQTAWFWGVLLQEDGRYVEAVSAYRRVLQKFPNDRATWRNLGRTYYLDEKFEQAIEAMEQVLHIDPEDRVAHYHIMLSARALNQTDRAEEAEQAYLLYKIDESADQVTKSYRLSHPHDNLEAQAIHIHDLTQKQIVRSQPTRAKPSESKETGGTQ